FRRWRPRLWCSARGDGDVQRKPGRAGTATIKRFVADGQPERDRALFQWAVEHSLYQIQTALQGVIANLPMRPAAWLLRAVCFPLGAWQEPPSDRLGSRVARGLLDNGESVQALTKDIYEPARTEEGLGRLEHALETVVAAREPHKKIKDAVRAKLVERHPKSDLVERALTAGVITAAEKTAIDEANAARDDIVLVDAFTKAEYKELRG
ncbi:MAG: acyl-CoA dehydrogenase domain-containing protein, partial [Planctomycetota bacterium]